MNGIPEAVLKQNEAAENLQKNLTSGETPPAPGVESQVPPADPKPSDPPGPDAKPKSDDFEHKYKVLQGKYAREVGDLRALCSRQAAIIDQQAATIDEFSRKPAAPAPAAPAEVGGVNPEDYAAYGTEIMDLAKTVNALIAENKRLSAAPPADDRIEKIERSVQEERTNRFYSDLKKACPTWESLNTDEKFLEWAGVVDPTYKISRLSVMKECFAQGDALGVAEIFNEYLKVTAPAPAAPRPILPGNDGGAPAPVGRPGENLAAMSEKLKQAQRDFMSHRINEAEFDKIAAEYQQALKASQSR